MEQKTGQWIEKKNTLGCNSFKKTFIYFKNIFELFSILFDKREKYLGSKLFGITVTLTMFPAGIHMNFPF